MSDEKTTPETPTTPVAETPATPVAETPATPVAATTATPAAETPATPVAETPATPVAETPATPAAETPAAATTETSTGPSTVTAANQQPETVVEENLAYHDVKPTPLPEDETELTNHKNRVAKAFEGKDHRQLVHKHKNKFPQFRTQEFRNAMLMMQNINIHFEEILQEIEKDVNEVSEENEA